MSAKQTTKAAKAEQPAPPPQPRADVSVRVKTTSPGVKRQVCGVIFGNEYKRLLLDDKGSAYKAIARDPELMMETLPNKPLSDDEVAADTLPGQGNKKEQEAT
ncbi:hypothetical protein [Halomonas llamarensis]|uniref:Mu-like prophage FluMu N-terminal domain-containing protein n=1 Tax=Halomonas llamarensis TaxID=2945104 RepID=A0ABT0SV81_9GAMM|nr:hypothetical protein [Halomonas llamarensis]MCL7931697.1 hypothetical protein [Halomonas llamarensis]